MATDDEITYAIMNGINFGGAKKNRNDKSDKVRTKAKKKGERLPDGCSRFGSCKAQGRNTPKKEKQTYAEKGQIGKTEVGPKP